MFKNILQILLKKFAKAIIKKYKPDVIGITGSIGKTSTKEAVFAVLSSKFNVRSNFKNYNNEIGLPLSVIGMKESPGNSIFGWVKVFLKAISLLLVCRKNYPEMLVLEMGADKPGDIQYLVEIAPCKVGVLTFIAHAHTEFFKTISKIVQEKRIIITHLKKDAFAVVNFDNDLVMQNINKTSAEIISYGLKEGADIRGTDINIITDEESGWPLGLNFKVEHNGSSVPVFLPGQVAEHLISSALAGLAVGVIFGINFVDCVAVLRKMPALAGHMRLLSGIKDTLIIDDTYNSSPEATKSALETLVKIKRKENARRFAVLGDMLELGPETEHAHKEIGLKVKKLDIDFLVTVGEASKYTANYAKEVGMDENKIAMFANSIQAGKFLQDKIKAGDIVLIKGSQGFRMEKVVREIMKDPLNAKSLLVRQGKGWN